MSREHILEKPWISATEIAMLLGISKGSARDLCHIILEEMKSEGSYILKSKELLVPTKRVRNKVEI